MDGTKRAGVRFIGLDPETLEHSIAAIEATGIGLKGFVTSPWEKYPDEVLRLEGMEMLEAPGGKPFTGFLLENRRSRWWNLPLLGWFPEKVLLAFEQTSCKNLLIKVNSLPTYVFAFRFVRPETWPDDLQMIHWSKYDELSRLQRFPQLRLIHLEQGTIPNLVGLNSMMMLEELKVMYTDSLTSIDGFGELPKLRTLTLHYCRSLASLRGIGDLPALEDLHLRNCERMMNLSGIDNLRGLRYLDLDGCHALRSIRGIEELKSLKTLRLVSMRIDDLHLLEGMPNQPAISTE